MIIEVGDAEPEGSELADIDGSTHSRGRLRVTQAMANGKTKWYIKKKKKSTTKNVLSMH